MNECILSMNNCALQIKDDIGKFKIQSDGSLQIIGVSRADAGSYTCIADNGFGVSALKQTQLSVNGTSIRQELINQLVSLVDGSLVVDVAIHLR